MHSSALSLSEEQENGILKAAKELGDSAAKLLRRLLEGESKSECFPPSADKKRRGGEHRVIRECLGKWIVSDTVDESGKELGKKSTGDSKKCVRAYSRGSAVGDSRDNASASSSRVDFDALPMITPSFEGCGGVLKASPSDFIVEELPLHPCSGDGGHAYVTIRREGANTMDVVKALAKAFDLQEEAVGYAGLKDRNAICTQQFSLPVGQDLVNPALNTDQVAQRMQTQCATCQVVADSKNGGVVTVQLELLGAPCFHSEALRRGQLQGNRFEVRLQISVFVWILPCIPAQLYYPAFSFWSDHCIENQHANKRGIATSTGHPFCPEEKVNQCFVFTSMGKFWYIFNAFPESPFSSTFTLRRGVPNYYGPQRTGKQGSTARAGRDHVLGARIGGRGKKRKRYQGTSAQPYMI